MNQNNAVRTIGELQLAITETLGSPEMATKYGNDVFNRMVKANFTEPVQQAVTAVLQAAQQTEQQ